MLPKAHAFYGGMLAAVTWFLYPDITLFQVLLIFLSSVFIDADHYIWYIVKQKDWNLKNSYYYLKNEIEHYQLMIFHTIEIIALVGFLGFVWIGFYYIWVGMLYHLALDLMHTVKNRNSSSREYFLIYHFIRKKEKYLNINFLR